ncbi:MAG: AraC family transcriptional regulator [Firmicutes bacterium]|nr:AraC family transcriptional regulator [Bacillota bacterium]
MKKSADLLSDALNFSVDKMEYKDSMIMPNFHFHEHYEMLYVFDNERNLFISDNCYLLNKNSVAFIPPYILHKTLCPNKNAQKRYLINFNTNYIKNILDGFNENILLCFDVNYPVITITPEEQNQFIFLLEEMLKQQTNKAPFSDSYTLSLFCSVLAMSSKIFHRQMNQKEKKVVAIQNKSRKTNEKIREIAEFIKNNYNEKITLKLLAEKFYLSPCYISRMFKKHMGVSLIQYINQIRIAKAQYLLLSTNNITAIAFTTGFDSLTHFDRTFKQILGISPLEYHKLSIAENAAMPTITDKNIL